MTEIDLSICFGLPVIIGAIVFMLYQALREKDYFGAILGFICIMIGLVLFNITLFRTFVDKL